MSRALRRHHYRRIKRKRKWYWGRPYREPGVRYMQTEAEQLGNGRHHAPPMLLCRMQQPAEDGRSSDARTTKL